MIYTAIYLIVCTWVHDGPCREKVWTVLADNTPIFCPQLWTLRGHSKKTNMLRLCASARLAVKKICLPIKEMMGKQLLISVGEKNWDPIITNTTEDQNINSHSKWLQKIRQGEERYKSNPLTVNTVCNFVHKDIPSKN